jgi:RimJ/RimL family protein N-acetyltransferase
MTTSAERRLDFRVDVPWTGGVALARQAAWGDVETLRLWKNANRSSFFHRAEIEPDEQRRWFEAFSARSDAQMFVLDVDDVPAGCVGFRFVSDDSVDLFNLILGRTELARSGVMSAFYRALELELAQRGIARIVLRVLEDNVAGRAFYARHGFSPCESPDDGRSLALEKRLERPSP